jgi:thiamine biosynthesis lipoprotein
MVIPEMASVKGAKLAERVEKIVESWERCLSAYRKDAELYHLNSFAADREIKISKVLSDVFDTCDHYHWKSGGLFDPAVNQNKSSWKELQRNPENRSVFFAGPHVKLDMGAIGKGIALEDVVAYLRNEGIKNAFLSFGESSLAGMGNHPHGEGWLVESGPAILLMNDFLSISGLQDHPGEEKKGSGAHIYHPLKGRLILTKRRVLVKSTSAVEAEVLSTCAYMADDQEFEKIKIQFPDAYWYVD